MVTLLIGENSFEIERALGKIVQNFNGVVERIDGNRLQLSQLPDILMGVSLFATARIVVVRNLSENKLIWSVFGDWLGKISDDIHLVLIESKPDKRTTTFKALKENATLKDFPVFSDRDLVAVEKWVSLEAEKMGLNMDKKSIQFLVARVGFDQWQLFYALQKLALVDEPSIDKIKDIIESNPVENVFNLFEVAVKGDRQELRRLVRSLEQSDDPYRLSALLFAQVFQLTVLSSIELAGKRTDNAVKDFGIHPFVASKLSLLAKKIGNRGLVKIVDIFVRIDDEMKLSKADPWVLIEKALLKVSMI